MSLDKGKETLLAENVEVKVGDEVRPVDIRINEHGNIIFNGLGNVIYEMMDEELYFMPVESEYEDI